MQTELITYETKKFELDQRRAKALSISAFFPDNLKGKAQTKEEADRISQANAVIVLDLASRMGLSPLEVAQSIFIIYNKPSFETKFLVARLNNSGKIKGRLKTIVSEDKQSAYCEAIDAQTNETITGMTVSIAMAKAEGWYNKNGSKWKTLPELMLTYRAQSFFISQYFPEVKFGLKTTDELMDMPEAKVVDEKKIDLNKIAKEKTKKKEKVEPEIIEVEPESSETTPLPGDILETELLKRGINENEADEIASKYSNEQIKAILNDPSSIDTIINDYFKG
ncbi:hypothetical protein CUREO_1260 [Campylobacter ureolyticus RIGS 9880]|uniref:Uncharacterized protein n=1 Tax=Campylobacter ureolyticus RIGS 9880 TaxID=1032069 RepID=A0AAU8U168_9BACT|nr:hypothetical protein [Campylobacter ureolyticus]AKT91104.1 hypothetical protein CUREO_1260 [Campylobacter ureolyticus RIGS 9880]